MIIIITTTIITTYKKRNHYISAHVDRCCSTDPKYSIFPFYKFHVNDVSARLSKEKYFLNIFNPKLNRTC